MVNEKYLQQKNLLLFVKNSGYRTLFEINFF